MNTDTSGIPERWISQFGWVPEETIPEATIPAVPERKFSGLMVDEPWITPEEAEDLRKRELDIRLTLARQPAGREKDELAYQEALRTHKGLVRQQADRTPEPSAVTPISSSAAGGIPEVPETAAQQPPAPAADDYSIQVNEATFKILADIQGTTGVNLRNMPDFDPRLARSEADQLFMAAAPRGYRYPEQVLKDHPHLLTTYRQLTAEAFARQKQMYDTEMNKWSKAAGMFTSRVNQLSEQMKPANVSPGAILDRPGFGQVRPPHTPFSVAAGSNLVRNGEIIPTTPGPISRPQGYDTVVWGKDGKREIIPPSAQKVSKDELNYLGERVKEQYQNKARQNFRAKLIEIEKKQKAGKPLSSEENATLMLTMKPKDITPQVLEGYLTPEDMAQYQKDMAAIIAKLKQVTLEGSGGGILTSSAPAASAAQPSQPIPPAVMAEMKAQYPQTAKFGNSNGYVYALDKDGHVLGKRPLVIQ